MYGLQSFRSLLEILSNPQLTEGLSLVIEWVGIDPHSSYLRLFLGLPQVKEILHTLQYLGWNITLSQPVRLNE